MMMNIIIRLKEQLKLFKFRFIEFQLYTICGIDFYRNYERFYWKNKNKKNES